MVVVMVVMDAAEERHGKSKDRKLTSIQQREANVRDPGGSGQRHVPAEKSDHVTYHPITFRDQGTRTRDRVCFDHMGYLQYLKYLTVSDGISTGQVDDR